MIELASHAFNALILIGSLLFDLAGLNASAPVPPAVEESETSDVARTSGPAPHALRAFAIDEP